MKIEFKATNPESPGTEKNSQKAPRKRWKMERSIHYCSSRRDLNDITESAYKVVLKEVKELFRNLQDNTLKTVFERDYRYDTSESSVAMHCFLTPCFYWYLECDYLYTYNIEYDFWNCPIEREILELMRKKVPFFQDRCKHKQHQPNCREFYNRVLQVQDSQFIYQL